MKNSTLIQRMADWLERKYFSQNTLSARARLLSYETIASSENAATASISTRSGRQYQPSQMAEGTTPTRIAFS